MSTSHSIYYLGVLCLCIVHKSLADVSHLLTSEYPQVADYFQFFQIPPPPDGIYGPPAIETYPQPVAPTPSTTTEFVLPEVVENRKAKDAGNFIPFRYNYQAPKPSYIPPFREDKPFSNGYTYEKPKTSTTQSPVAIVVPELDDQYNGYNYQVPAPVYLPQNSIVNTNLEPRSRIQDMRCLRHHGGYFHTVLQVENLQTEVPVLDNDSYDERCAVKQAGDSLVIDISESDFGLCGVKDCGKDLCLRLRFPIIRGMRTANDGIITLHCKSQDRVAAKTYALKVGVANDVQARNLGVYAHGGSQNAFRTHVELLRRSNNVFTHHLEPNEAVQLGEELLLRAHVLAGDGWNHTKLTDVSLQRQSPSGEILNVVHLINSQGCNNPNTQSICAQAPVFDAPLGHKLIFKAVMFQGMHSGEELIMSMRITGCLEAQDCQVQNLHCGLANQSILGRRKRNTSNATTDEASEISRISFRVAFEENQTNTIDIEESEAGTAAHAQMNFILLETLAFVILLLCLGIFLFLKFN